jgi:hypothetical protein
VALNNGLVGYWKFDETSGTSLVDSSGYGNTGTANGSGGTNTSGPVASTSVSTVNFTNTRSRNFDGTDDYVNLGTPNSLSITSVVSVSAWINMSVLGTDAGTVCGGSGDWCIQKLTNNTLRFENLGVSSAGTSSALSTGWNHIAVTYDGANVKYYINGIQDGPTVAYVTTFSPGQRYIGAYNYGGITSFFPGNIDDVRIYNRALSATEVAALAAGNNPAVGSGTATITSSTTIVGTFINNSGTLSLGSQNLTLTGTSVNNGGTFLPSTGTVTYDGTGTYTSLPLGNTYYNLVFNNPASTWTLSDNLTTSNNLTITAGTLDVSASGCSSASCNITVGGTWSRSGTFTPRTGTVTLNGTSQSILGNTTFYNLTKSVSSADTLTFQSSSTTTTSSGGTLTLQGTSGHLLSLRSSSPGTTWNLALHGNQSISYVDTRDSDASTGSTITQTNSTSSGNNTNWTFPTVDAGLDQVRSSAFTPQATASTTNSSLSYLWTTVSGPGSLTFSSPTSLTTTVEAFVNGTYVVRLTATDAGGFSSSDDFTLVWSRGSTGTAPTTAGVPTVAVPQINSNTAPALTNTPSTTQNQQSFTVPSAAVFTTPLKPGDQGSEVTKLQTTLQALGFLPSTTTPNGVFGPKTQDALKAFQQSHNLPALGQVGPKTLEALNQAEQDRVAQQTQASLNQPQSQTQTQPQTPSSPPSTDTTRQTLINLIQQLIQHLQEQITKAAAALMGW